MSKITGWTSWGNDRYPDKYSLSPDRTWTREEYEEIDEQDNRILQNR